VHLHLLAGRRGQPAPAYEPDNGHGQGGDQNHRDNQQTAREIVDG